MDRRSRTKGRALSRIERMEERISRRGFIDPGFSESSIRLPLLVFFLEYKRVRARLNIWITRVGLTRPNQRHIGPGHNQATLCGCVDYGVGREDRLGSARPLHECISNGVTGRVLSSRDRIGLVAPVGCESRLKSCIEAQFTSLLGESRRMGSKSRVACLKIQSDSPRSWIVSWKA